MDLIYNDNGKENLNLKSSVSKNADADASIRQSANLPSVHLSELVDFR